MDKKLKIRNSTAEFLTFTIQEQEDGVEVRLQDETIWLSQKLMGVLFECSSDNISLHLKHIFQEGELEENSVTEYFSATESMEDWSKKLDAFLQFNEYDLLNNIGKVSSEVAKAFAESEFEKYRIIQDRLFQSDFDRLSSSGLLNFETKK